MTLRYHAIQEQQKLYTLLCELAKSGKPCPTNEECAAMLNLPQEKWHRVKGYLAALTRDGKISIGRTRLGNRRTISLIGTPLILEAAKLPGNRIFRHTSSNPDQFLPASEPMRLPENIDWPDYSPHEMVMAEYSFSEVPKTAHRFPNTNEMPKRLKERLTAHWRRSYADHRR